jgi:hypothetical protein
MEGGKVRGMLWLLAGWFTLFLVMCVILANIGCMPVETAVSPGSGTICMTAEALDRQLVDAYADGYAKAKADAPAQADVELDLWDSPAQIMAFLKSDDCDRCQSSVPSEGPELACLDRAECLLFSMRLNGMDGYGVIMNFQNDGAHAIVAFPMKDGTLLFVEPWLDQIVPTPEIGKPYLTDRIYFQYKTSGLLIIEKIGILR